MTQEERLIVSGYTGELMVGTQDFLKFAEKVLDRPVKPIEFGDYAFWALLRAKLSFQFKELCEFCKEREVTNDE